MIRQLPLWTQNLLYVLFMWLPLQPYVLDLEGIILITFFYFFTQKNAWPSLNQNNHTDHSQVNQVFLNLDLRQRSC